MYPKQFIRLPGQKSSLLAATLMRLKANSDFAAPILVCNNDHRFLVRDEAQAAGVEPHAVILEPVPRNTAPAIAVAALAVTHDDPDAILAILPSDHMIQDEAAFAESMRRAAEVAATGKLVLLGIVPTKPHTGYGYIRQGAPLEGHSGAHAVSEFREKPDRTTAQEYLNTGEYFWNSGIFVLGARAYLEELRHFEPSILEAARAALAGASEDLEFLRLDQAAFASAPSISIDYAVMEKTSAAAMLPLDAGWSDVGSWSSLWEITPRDENDNAVQGDVILLDTTGCYVNSEHSLVSTIGVKDLIIVNTPDALLVANKGDTQDLSGLMEKLRQLNRTEREQHLRNHRPWGYFETLTIGPHFQVKLLHVKPGGKLSLQKHFHRSEHWVVVRGTAKVTIGDNEELAQENESVYIAATQWHRLENPGSVPLEMIEVQLGTYLGEDDIVRADDIYRRAPEETK